MVSFYTGTPGSGKSFHMAKFITDLLRFQNVNVIANFDINLENAALTKLGWMQKQLEELTNGKIHFKSCHHHKMKGRFYYWTNDQITVDNLLTFGKQHHTKPNRKNPDDPQTILFIDEAGTVFNCRGFSDGARNKWLWFFAKHRHYCFNVVLAAQFDRQVDKQIRGMVEVEHKHFKLKNYKFIGWLVSTLVGGNIFMIKKSWYAAKLFIGTDFCRFNQRIASVYDTLAEFDAELGTAPAGIVPDGVRGPVEPGTPEPTNIASAPREAKAFLSGMFGGKKNVKESNEAMSSVPGAGGIDGPSDPVCQPAAHTE